MISPENLTNPIQSALRRLGVELRDSKKISEAVLRLSDFYIANPSDKTPWDQKWTQIAYLGYFLPLNYVRVAAALQRVSPFRFLESVRGITDFGSGPGTATLALLSEAGFERKMNVHCIETSPVARAFGEGMLKALGNSQASTQFSMSVTEPQDLFLASYALTELSELPDFVFKHPKILLIEPSTKDDSRRLIGWRSQLINAGFEVVAPCCHQDKCPMEDSKRDWCHDRTGWEMPGWFEDIETLLPIKNRSLTFSYLALEKIAGRQTSASARMTGDLQTFKGYSKQMVCRGPEREFLSWQSKVFRDPPSINRGDLVEISGPLEQKADELRPSSETQIRVLHSLS